MCGGILDVEKNGCDVQICRLHNLFFIIFAKNILCCKFYRYYFTLLSLH